jgi:hypothetical protein
VGDGWTDGLLAVEADAEGTADDPAAGLASSPGPSSEPATKPPIAKINNPAAAIPMTNRRLMPVGAADGGGSRRLGGVTGGPACGSGCPAGGGAVRPPSSSSGWVKMDGRS